MGMYIIAEPCIGTKDTACVDVCPVDCIHPRKDEDGVRDGGDALHRPATSASSAATASPACPVTAIFTEETIPEKWKHFLQVNADWYKNRTRPPSPHQERTGGSLFSSGSPKSLFDTLIWCARFCPSERVV